MRRKRVKAKISLDTAGGTTDAHTQPRRKIRRRRSKHYKKKQIKVNPARRRTDVADCLKDAADSYFSHIGYSGYKEIGLNSWGKLRADFVGVNLKSKIVVVEIKSSPSDYKGDCKWDKYLEYADRFFFCVSHDTYKKIRKRLHRELPPKGAGLLVLSPDSGYLEVKIRCKERAIKDVLRLSLITRLAWRSGFSKRTQRNRRRHFLQ